MLTVGNSFPRSVPRGPFSALSRQLGGTSGPGIAGIQLSSGCGTLRPTIIFHTLYRSFFLPFPHKPLTTLIWGPGHLAFRWRRLADSILCLAPHRLRTARRTGLLRLNIRRGTVRAASSRVCAGFRFPGMGLVLSMRRLFQPVYSLPGNGSGRILGAVDLSVLPLPVFSGVPELALQFFRAREKAAPKEFLRRGHCFFFCFLGNGLFFFDFFDTASPLFCIFRCGVVNYL